MLACAAALAQAQGVYATHDWTASSVGPEPIDQFRETWADVKTPGDNFQYSVGTIEVRTTAFGAVFSGDPADPVFEPADPSFPGPFTFLQGFKQVVIVQCTLALPAAAPSTQPFQSIQWQKYFYGGPVLGGPSSRATNARGISVWPTGNPETTRIAICGETYDERIPGAAPDAFPLASATAPTGFIAVLDGNGTLLWSHHVFGSDETHSCAITDLSIRVEADGRETVTYCGISSHGDPGAGTPLTPKLDAVGFPGSSGSWDGIVGRVSRDTAGTKKVEFHANTNVIGDDQDGLFGLAEVEVDLAAGIDRFVVVGSLTLFGPGSNTGVAMSIDAAPTRATPATDAVLDGFTLIGDAVEGGRNTIARDVLVLRDGYLDSISGSLFNACVVVGSTDDPNVFAGLPWPAPAAHAGGADGFVMLLADYPAPLSPLGGSYFGGPGDDGLTGVQGWNEFPDSFVVAGFTHGPAGGSNQDIGFASYYLDTSVGGVSPTSIRVVRQDQIGGSTVPAGGGSVIERPAGMGTVQALAPGVVLPFFTNGLDDPAGGGVAVDQRARVNVVGYTDAADFFVNFPSPPGVLGRARDPRAPADAVRTVYDMLPRAASSLAIGRTDGTGDQGTFVLPTGLTGGTTPACALNPFGHLIGGSPAVLPRILVDYEGDPPQAGVVNGYLIASRPSNFVFTAWQWDIPPLTGPSAPALVLSPPLINGVEVFVPDAISSGAIFLAAAVMPGQSIRVPVNFPLPGSVPYSAMTVQVICWAPFAQPGGLTCDVLMGDSTEIVGSAGMWLPL